MSRYTWAISALLALVGAQPIAAQGGTIVGRVVDRTSNAPLTGAQVYVVGTTLGGLANQNGQYIVREVPAGEHEVRATLIGYGSVAHRVTVRAGETARQDFALGESAIQLDAVVVSATGQQQTKREIGSSVGVISTADVELGTVSTFSNLLQGRSAGLTVLDQAGTSGTGSRIRIRGANSISLDNSPLLVIDGVRVNSDPSVSLIGSSGGPSPSAYNDLNPENIESIEVLKGPAASALYGTAAANGVIQVTTKRGRAGQSQISAWTEFTQLEVSTDFPDNVQGFQPELTGDPNVADAADICSTIHQAYDLCDAPTVFRRANPLGNAATTVFDGGSRQSYGASVSGGGEGATFFLSGEKTDEESVFDSENFIDKWNLQANMTGQISEKLQIRGTAGLVESDAQFPQSDNALFGALGMGLYGFADSASVANNDGGYSYPLQFHYDWKTFQKQTRFTTSAAADWAPIPWLSVNASAGLDRISREDETRIPRVNAFGPVFGSVYTAGFIQVNQWNIYNLNTNLSGSAIFDVTPSLVSTTTLGTQYIRENSVFTYAFGSTLTPGIEESLAGATADFAVSEGNVLNGTVSAYGQQQMAYQNRLFLNAALRGDQNTAFGTDIGWIWYPAVSGSWVVSEENFFPQSDILTDFRLRAAFGQAGLRPAATAALLSFTGAIGTFDQTSAPAIVINQLGNTELKPERTTEWEIGFEAGLLDSRLGLETTYYTKTSTDALVNKPLPPSPGGSANRFENLGEVRNSGLEFTLRGEAVRKRAVRWNFGFRANFLDNELVDLGRDNQGNPIPAITFAAGRQRHAEGYPLGGYWQPPIQSYQDTNGDGVLQPNEVVVGVRLEDGTFDADSAAFIGYSFPKRELSFDTDVTLWNAVRLSALFDHKGDYYLVNQTRTIRCTSSFNCPEVYEGSLEEQAAAMAYSEYGSFAGYIERADFVKLRELAVTFMVPSEWTQRFRTRDLRLTLAGRNLATWTDYTGLDPEVNSYGAATFAVGGDFAARDISTLPPNRMLTLRIDANF